MCEYSVFNTIFMQKLRHSIYESAALHCGAHVAIRPEEGRSSFYIRVFLPSKLCPLQQD